MTLYLLSIGVVGVVFVVWLAYFLWGKESEAVDLGDQSALDALLQFDYPGVAVKDVCFSADRKTAYAFCHVVSEAPHAHETAKKLFVFYVHGIFRNIRALDAKSIQTIRLEEDAEFATLLLFVNAFDREHFALSVRKADAFAQAEQWLTRLQDWADGKTSKSPPRPE